jgi:hypothetical protein
LAVDVRQVIVGLITAAAALAASVSAQPPQRLVAVGDLHGDIGVVRQVFKLAGAIDDSGAWVGGNLVVVQTGDFIGRGPDEKAVVDFLFDVRQKAERGGGKVHMLIGNHEVFAARPDHRWVDPDAFAAFDGMPGLNLSDPRLANVPPAQRSRASAFAPGGVYARRLSELPVVLKIGRTVFAHGGILPMWARYGIDRINAEVRDWFAGRTAEPAPTLGLDDGSADDGVMWSRHFAAAPEPLACAVADESLKLVGGERMVVAHTVQKVITSRCGGRIWAIDSGMSKYYGGQPQILEIVNDSQVRVIGPRP